MRCACGFVRKCLTDFPDEQAGEGIIQFDGVDHFFTYAIKGEIVEAAVGPRDDAERVLNEHGWSTRQPDEPLSS